MNIKQVHQGGTFKSIHLKKAKSRITCVAHLFLLLLIISKNESYLTLSLTHECWVTLHSFLQQLILSLTSNVFDLRNTIRVLNSLNSDQAQHFVGPDLGPNSL